VVFIIARTGTISERGKFKEEIHKALFQNNDIRELLLGNTDETDNLKLQKQFKKYVKSHLFVDGTIQDTGTFIFYDVIFPYLRANTKECRVMTYILTHRDVLENYVKEGYYGNRVDILSQMVEDTLINNESVANSFGIGRLSLDSVNIYNSNKFYGSILVFGVPNFR